MQGAVDKAQQEKRAVADRKAAEKKAAADKKAEKKAAKKAGKGIPAMVLEEGTQGFAGAEETRPPRRPKKRYVVCVCWGGN